MKIAHNIYGHHNNHFCHPYSVLGALTGVASISLVEGGADLYDSSHVVAGALSVVADDLGVGAALTFLGKQKVSGDS